MNIDVAQTTKADDARTIPPMRGTRIAARTLGEGWLEVVDLILAHGRPSTFNGLPLLETELVTLDVSQPDPDDAVINRHADTEWLAWMRANFTERTRVAALGGARSYASRIYDYAETGRDQIDWIVNTLQQDPIASYAAITTFEPLLDTTYIPCISLLDFWLRAGQLEVVVYAHSIDFGKKGYGNLIQIAELQHHVANRLGVPVGALAMVIKSATIYTSEVELMRRVLEAAQQ